MTQVGQVSVGLGLDDAQFKAGIQKANNDTQAFAKKMNAGLSGIAKGFTVGAVLVGLNKLKDMAIDSVEAYRKQERAIQSLDNALMNSGTYTTQYANNLKKLSSEIQSYSNYGDEAVEQSLALAQSYAGNIQLTDELIKATVDYAAATGTDLNTAFTLVGKSIGTSTNALARYGVTLDKNMTKEQKAEKITQVLGQRFSGQAKNMANASEQLKNATGDLSEAFGRILNPAVEKTQNVLTKGAQSLTDWINKIRIMNTEIKKLVSEQELNMRLQENMQKIGNLAASYGNYQKGQMYKELQAENQQIIAQIKYLRGLGKQKEETSKANYIPISSGGDEKEKSTKDKTDKALEEYKTFVEGFKQATNDYNATLKARNYVEKTLGLTVLSEDYAQSVEVYKNYYKERTDIEQSGAKNKAVLLKMEETKLQQELQKIALSKTDETQKKTWDIIKSYQEERQELILSQQAYQEAGGFLGSFATGYSERLNILKWYMREYDKLINTHFNSAEEKENAFNELLLTKTMKTANAEIEIWRQRGHEVANIFQNSLSNMLTNYGDFSDNMKQLALNLINYMIKEVASNALTSAIQVINANKSMSQSFFSMISPISQMSNNFNNIAISAPTAAAGITAMGTAQNVLAPLLQSTNNSVQQATTSYMQMAVSAKQLAASMAQLAISQAAYSVAQIPYVGGFLAPVAAGLTAAAIAVGTLATTATTTVGQVASKFHSGGTILPTGSKHHYGGTQLPQTDQTEHFALLKNNERVLSPSETSAYNQGESQAQPNYIVFAPTVKAMDSRDVAQWFNDNKQQIIGIVSDGIKNNKQGLRTQIQGV